LGILSNLVFGYDNSNSSLTDDIYKTHISITSPVLDKHLTDEQICDSLFTRGEKKIRGFGEDDTKGYEVVLAFNDESLGGSSYLSIQIPSSAGYQTNDAKLVIDEVTKTDQGNMFVYLIKGRLICKLFAPGNSNAPSRLVYDVKDGRFAQRIEAFK
jgi:hypothetical protein